MAKWTEAAFVGGHPALDFLNTVDNQDKARSESRIAGWSDFLGWAAGAGVFGRAELRRLRALESGKGTAAILAEVHHLREAAFAVLSARAAKKTPPSAPWARLEDRMKQALSRASLEWGGAGCLWRADPAQSQWVVDSLALSLEALLRSPELARLRECGRCSWLFVDHGRGRGRRWCDMRTCGNRAKAAAFRAR